MEEVLTALSLSLSLYPHNSQADEQSAASGSVTESDSYCVQGKVALYNQSNHIFTGGDESVGAEFLSAKAFRVVSCEYMKCSVSVRKKKLEEEEALK